MNDQKSNDLTTLILIVVLTFFAALAIMPVVTVILANSNPVRFRHMSFKKCVKYGVSFATCAGILGMVSTLQWSWLGESLYQVGRLQIDHKKVIILSALNLSAVSILLFTNPIWTKFLIKKTDLRNNLF
jgi:hypothetical protein